MSTISPIVFLGLFSLTDAAQAPARNITTEESTLTARIETIERSSRLVKLHDGNMFLDVYVDPKIATFDELKVGDVVTVRYTVSRVVQVRRNATPTPIQDTTEQARKDGDEDVFQQLKTTVTIEEIDSQGLFVTYRRHHNLREVRSVSDKRLLQGIRPGDQVEITLTRARAVSIERGRP